MGYKNGMKWVTRMYCFGLQKWNKTGYKNGMDWITRIDFRMTGVRTGMHFSESWMHFKKHDEAVTGFSVAGLTFQFTLKKSQFRIIIHIHTYNRLIQGIE